MEKFTPFLMFVGAQHGKAEEAINLYISLFKNSKIVHLDRYGAGEDEPEGSVRHAIFTLGEQEFMAIDSAREHPFTFTPAVSIFVNCEDESEIDRVYKKLSEGGQELMAIDNHGFSKKFGWINDKYGVSWQLNLP